MSDTKREGTQAIRRAASILRHVAAGPGTGVGLRDIAEAMDLSRSTAHRILKCLQDERLIESGENGRGYVIGSLTYELGLSASGRQRDVMKWRGAIDGLARDTGATVYLMGRSGVEAVCLYKAEGTGVVRVIPVEVGQRRPLGVGAGATALLAATTDADLDRVLESIEPYLDAYPALGLDLIRRNVAAARRNGFAESEGTVVGEAYGLGLAIPPGQGPATLALSLAAHRSTRTPERTAAWKRLMTRALRLVVPPAAGDETV